MTRSISFAIGLALAALTTPAQAQQGSDQAQARQMFEGKMNLEQIAEHVEAEGLNPSPRSGKQEYLESVVNTYL